MLAGVQIVRGAIVAANEGRGALAATAWPDHPESRRASIMAEVGAAAGRGEEPSPESLAELRRLAMQRPLAAEPFLVQGAMELRRGDHRRAEQLLLTARDRHPRSTAARYLLADLYLRRGEVVPAMREMAVLGRFIPNAAGQLAPALADYARTPGAIPKVKAILAAYPEIEPALLGQLAADPANAPLVMSLASAGRDGGPAPWQEVMVAALVERGEYRRAHSMWRQFAGLGDQIPLLFNPGFQKLDVPPPFNWKLANSSGGVADPVDDGIELLYFGRDDISLARQLLLLPAGSYRLSMRVAGGVSDPRSLRWSLRCLGSKAQLVDLPLPAEAGERGIDSMFTVPAGCTAQSLDLLGEGREFPERSSVTIRQLRLAQVGQ